MNKKNSVKGKLIILMVVIISVLILAFFALCTIKRIQNEKSIIGTWTQDNLEEVLTFYDNGSLIVNQDMPEVGISSGSADYEFIYTDTIRVVQGENSVEFEIKVDKNQLRIFFIEQEYLVLQKQ